MSTPWSRRHQALITTFLPVRFAATLSRRKETPMSWNGAVLAAFVATEAFAAPVPPPKPAAKKKDEPAAKGRTVLLGTWSWDISANKFGAGGDVWWEQVSNKERNLVPRNGAGWAILKGKRFEDVGLDDLKKASFSEKKLSGALLRPGTVLALRTRQGHFAKLQVVRYRELHDFAFPEARHLKPEWIQLARASPNVKEYHLELSWGLYHDKK
jgi:hypothetical protein